MSAISSSAAADAVAAVRRLTPRGVEAAQRTALLAREWLVSNGLGGYAAGTVGGAPRVDARL